MKKILLLAAALFLILSVQSQEIPFDHVDPPFWWSGMKHDKLQILIHGTDISHLEPKTETSGVIIEQIRRVSNPNYLFIDLNIADAKPGNIAFHFHDKSTRSIIDMEYQLLERKEGSAEREGFSSEDVIYLLMPDRFANGDPSNDSHPDMSEKADRKNPNGRHGGDLKGIIDNLDYISDMGFTALWLNPYQENNNPEYSYHGYAITDFYKTDPRIGTNEDYLELVKLSHQKGIKVIMDYILNHSSIYHWFIEDMPSENWIHQHEEFTYSNFRGSAISDPYASDFDLNQMLTGWFDRHMPDLDQRNELLSTYLIQNTIWWIEYSGIDGIRLDTQPYPYKEMVADWAERIFYEYPEFNVVGEAWLQKEALTAFFQETNRGKHYNSHIPSITDFPLHGAITRGLMEPEGWNTGLYRIYYTLAQDFIYPDPFMNVIFLDNHDVDRFSYLTDQDMELYEMAVAMLLTMRGIPQIYYGTELLMDGEKNKGHGFIREDYPGGWKSDEASAFTGKGLKEDVLKAQKFMQKILQWRKTSDPVHLGSFKHFLPDDQVYVYAREYNGQTVLVVVSKNESKVEFEYSRYHEVLKGAEEGLNIIDGQKVNLNDFSILPRSVYILEIK